ncbi:hypothetical protein [Spirosoma areae]
MHASLTVKQENKAKATWISICTFSRLFVLGFIQQNGFVFESFSRLSAPFGGSLLSSNR